MADMAEMAQEALFADEPTLRVGELAARLTRAVAAAFPGEVWVRGEVDGLRRPGPSGHVYFNLCERNSRRGPTSTVSVALYRTDRLRVERELRAWPSFRLDDGLEVRLRGRVQYGYGRIQLVVTAIDPVHTLGQLAADRERVLRALAAEGLLEANRRLRLGPVPLHVAVVTRAGSAACEDVLAELRTSGFGFRVSLVDAQVQGTAAVPSMLRALTVAGRLGPDVVLLVRGGGARTDLAPFDDERLARAVARSPVPVVAGVGHEIDSTVADEVAHTSAKTPTAAAAGVVALVARTLDRAEVAWAGVARRGTALAAGAGERLDERAARLTARTDRALATATARLDRRAGAVELATGLRLGAEAARLEGLGRRVDGRRLVARLDRLESELAAAGGSLHRTADRRLERAERDLAGRAALAAAADPDRALARGFSVTRTADGRLVREPAEVAPGDALVTTLAGGAVRSTVAEEGS
jgi:exodeoxyribonuclease VII large subunit